MKCKPGDLALVVGGLPENRGRFVIVERRSVPGEVLAVVGTVKLKAPDDYDWVVRPVNGTLASRGALTNKLYQVPLGAYKDKNLRPIRPDELDETTETLTKETT